MKTIIFSFFTFLVVVSSKPVHEDGVVEVYTNTQGEYKYSFSSKNITIAEEKNEEGNVVGFYSYIDDNGERQTVEYQAGTDGFKARGSIIGLGVPFPVGELPEVQEARLQHQLVSAEISKLLPKLKLGEDIVEEQPIVPLTKKEQLSAIEEVLNPKYLAFAEETAEVKEAKQRLFEAYATALA